jgi:hypothetical protein
MTQAKTTPDAVIVLVVDGRELPIAAVRATTPGDLQLVDQLARLFLRAARMGWTIRLTDLRPDLRDVVELAGLGECFGLP